MNNDLDSVTIVSKEEKRCDALSTSLFVMGKNAAIDYSTMFTCYELTFI
ncbi:FAD:protein FMN transferase [Negativibacillus massiliensis]|nr:FAD:protein FMN transferase [Negativibacillus massiliensis]